MAAKAAATGMAGGYPVIGSYMAHIAAIAHGNAVAAVAAVNTVIAADITGAAAAADSDAVAGGVAAVVVIAHGCWGVLDGVVIADVANLCAAFYINDVSAVDVCLNKRCFIVSSFSQGVNKLSISFINKCLLFMNEIVTMARVKYQGNPITSGPVALPYAIRRNGPKN